MSKYMRRLDNVKIKRYVYEDSRTDKSKFKLWYVDIVEGDNMGNNLDMFEAFIAPVSQYDKYGKMEYMFGIPKEQSNGQNVDFDMFLEIVENNIGGYIDIYINGLEWI